MLINYKTMSIRNAVLITYIILLLLLLILIIINYSSDNSCREQFTSKTKKTNPSIKERFSSDGNSYIPSGAIGTLLRDVPEVNEVAKKYASARPKRFKAGVPITIPVE